LIVYHGTTQKSAKRIRMEGFLPKPPSNRVWFAQSEGYAQRRARTKAQRAHDRPVVLKCNVDVDRLRQRYGGKRVVHRSSVLVVSAPVPATAVRFNPVLGVPSAPDELAHWTNTILGVKPHKGVGKRHPGVLRLAGWIEERLKADPQAQISERELLGTAQQFLPEYFEGVHVDFEHLRTLPRAYPGTTETETDEPVDEGTEEALDCLVSPKPKRRIRGLDLLAELQDPDLFDWCALYLEDESIPVRVQALKIMQRCDDIDPELIAPLADVEEKTIRAAAIETLALCVGMAPQWYWRGLTDPSPHVRLTVARQLQHLDPTAHRNIFETARYDPHVDVARIAEKLIQGKGFEKRVW
jgi:hypothetical protein